VIISVVQRQTALTLAQKDLLQNLAQNARRYFRQLDEVEWTVTRERATVLVSIRVRARSGVFRARGAAASLPAAARDALERALRQRSQAKRARVDQRDDGTVKGSGGRRGRKASTGR
jgi:hypothetical protein